jgi:hypothetical protein
MHTTKCQATDKRSCIYKKSTMRQIIIFLVENLCLSSDFFSSSSPTPFFFFFFNRLPCILLYVNWHATGKEKKIKRKFLPCFLDYEWLKTCIFNVREFRKNKNLFVLKNKWIRNSNFISRIFFFFLPLMMQNFTHGMQQEKNIHVEIKY